MAKAKVFKFNAVKSKELSINTNSSIESYGNSKSYEMRFFGIEHDTLSGSF